MRERNCDGNPVVLAEEGVEAEFEGRPFAENGPDDGTADEGGTEAEDDAAAQTPLVVALKAEIRVGST